jgi:aryl-alcohol dehydrogenase-like predicted oxidoreductase
VRHLGDDTVGTVPIGDRRVRRIGFGAARIVRTDRANAHALVRRAYARGVNFIDVAALYGAGACEEIVAEALWPYPADCCIASKTGYSPARGAQRGKVGFVHDGRPATVRATCDDSLRRLRVDHLDLYQVHGPDPAVPWAETVGAFAELRADGKVRAVGLSNVSVAELDAAAAIVPVASVQNRYSVAHRASEPVLRACETRGIPFIPWSPNLWGAAAVALLAEIGAVHGVSPQQVSVRWLLHRSAVMLPIPGTTQIAHLDDNVDLAWLELSADELDRLDRFDWAPDADATRS